VIYYNNLWYEQENTWMRSRKQQQRSVFRADESLHLKYTWTAKQETVTLSQNIIHRCELSDQ